MVLLKTSENLQGNTCAGISFLTNSKPEVCNFIEKEGLRNSCFPVKFAKFLRTPFFRPPPVAASESLFQMFCCLVPYQQEKCFVSFVLGNQYLSDRKR